MKLNKTILTSILILSFISPSISYAGDYYGGGKNTLGTLLGAAGGAALGSNIGKGKGRYVAVAVGTLLGAGIGGSVGKSLDRADRSYYNQPHYRRAHREYGYYAEPSYDNYVSSPYVTTNYQVNNYPTYTTHQVASVSAYPVEPAYCREFIQAVTIGGRVQESYGTACRKPDGSWEIQP